MSEISPILQAIFRWGHIVAGITWIGLLYFFNWVNAPLQLVLSGETKKAVNPELLPRALFWFRWGAAWTWATGVLLLMLVFYHGGLTTNTGDFSGGALAMIAVTFLAVFVYDAAMKVDALKDLKTMFFVGLVVVAILTALYEYVGDFSYRAMNIHLGAAFGTAMAFNVWFVIWPNQKIALGIVDAPDEAKPKSARRAMLFSRTNTLLSIPMLYGMVAAQNSPF